MGNFYKQYGSFLGIIDSSVFGGTMADPLALSKIVYYLDKFIETIQGSYQAVTGLEVMKLMDKLVLQVDVSTTSLLVDLAIKKNITKPT